jgi:Uma2 family endonuclease
MALKKPNSKAPWGEYVPNVGSLTVDEFAQLPDEDGWTYELYQGRLIRMPGPGGEHGMIQWRLTSLLATYLNEHHIAGQPFGTACYYFPLPSGEEILSPDLSYIAPPRSAAIVYRGSYIETVPDLVIEISSPNDFRPKVAAKAQNYLAVGVRLVWVVWPSTKTVDVWTPANTAAPVQTLTAADMLDGLDVIPGLSTPVQSMFGQ